MSELRELITSYVNGEIDYVDFRRAFVVKFSSARNADKFLDGLADTVASECDDLSTGRVDETELKMNLANLLRNKFYLQPTAFFGNSTQAPIPSLKTASATSFLTTGAVVPVSFGVLSEIEPSLGRG